MLKLRLLLTTLISICSLSALPCGNEYYTAPTDIPVSNHKLRLKELLRYSNYTYPYWHTGFGNNIEDRHYELIEKIAAAGIKIEDNYNVQWSELQTALTKKVDYKLLSDFAWYELRVGNKENAVKLLEALYKDHPNEYNIVANLGTAYEVTGKNEKALTLLKKAVDINPQSHNGSEWIHVRILQQKVNPNPNYANIIDIETAEHYNKAITPDSLMIQIAFQLHERISFIAPPDPIVGQLVMDFADLVVMTHKNVAEAFPFYNLALKYDPALVRTIREKLPAELLKDKPAIEAKTESVKIEEKKKKDKSLAWVFMMIAVVAGGIVIYAVNKRKSNKA